MPLVDGDRWFGDGFSFYNPLMKKDESFLRRKLGVYKSSKKIYNSYLFIDFFCYIFWYTCSVKYFATILKYIYIPICLLTNENP